MEMIKLLLKNGVNINRRSEKGATPLHLAALWGPAAVVGFLLSSGARNWIMDNSGKRPIDYARASNVSQGKDAIIKLFSEPLIKNPFFQKAVNAITVGDLPALQKLLKKHPDLVHIRAEEKGEYAGTYFSHPYLLEFVPENPVRTRQLPSNICEIAQAIIEAGAPRDAINKTLGLTASGCVPRECGVQTELLELFVRNGADPTAGLDCAISEGEWNAAKTLLRLGARLGLQAAAGLGKRASLKKLLSSSTDSEEWSRAANAAIRGGHEDCVRLLLDAGLSARAIIPNHPYTPTLLHQAALSGNPEIVELLLERGADLTATDTQFRGTPEDWARHAGHTELVERLRSKAAPAG